MSLRLSLGSVVFFFLSLTCTTTFAIDTFQQKWSGLDDEGYIENLVNCQKTIKELQWSYNIWPKENKTPRPLFADVLNKDHIYNQVIGNLRKQTVLANEFGVELSKEMLQGELDRMARDTKDPSRLQELYASLNNDPTSITECVARPNLVNRLLQDQFKYSQIIHGELNRQAKSELLRYQQSNILDSASAEVYTFDYVVEDLADGGSESPVENDYTSVTLDQQSFDEKLNNLSDPESGSAQLQELDSAFFYEEIIDQSPSSLKVKTLVWKKEGLNSWLAKQDRSIQTSPVSKSGNNFLLAKTGDTKIETASASASVAGPPDTWKDFSAIPRIRTQHTAVWTGTEMIVWGGHGASISVLVNTGARYNPATDAWVATSLEGAPTARNMHTSIWTGKEMVVWGGSEGNEGTTNTGGRYDPLTDSWTATSLTDAPSDRWLHTAVWSGTGMIVWGGNVDDTLSGFLDTGGVYDPLTNSWAPTSLTDAPSRRWRHTAVWTGEKMIVWGGSGDPKHKIFLNTGGVYNPLTNSWTTTSLTDAASRRGGHTAVWTGEKMIVWGGSGGDIGDRFTGGRYDPGLDNWSAMTTVNVPTARTSHTSIWTDTEMIVWGGLINLSRTNTGSRYNPASDTWTTTSITSAPRDRRSHTAVWTGNEMIVFGGNSSITEHKTGGRYDPVNDSWKATPFQTVLTISGRTMHSAVWSGAEMLVWGGVDKTVGFANSGARYDPVTDYWVQMTLDNAPDPRAEHSAHWTGTEMLVWGGGDDGGKFNSGGRYDPDVDSWSVMTTVNAPTARSAHTSIWAGSEMIVWGGNDGGSVDTGALYDPGLNSWSTITTTGAPSARESHTAVWTDTEMIVWGGGDDDTGGRYDPGADTWTATETLNAPVARNSHTAIWTGTEMVIWGGQDDLGLLDSGARYDPDTGLWDDTSLTNVPTGRYFHSAVWSDTEMLVWGGIDGGNVTKTGSRYNPDTDIWTTITTTDAPWARQHHATVWTGTEMIVMGGNSGTAKSAGGGRYNPDTNKWRAITESNKLAFTTNHSVIWTGENMIVWGGDPEQGPYSNLGGAYDIETNTWSPLAVDNAPVGRQRHTAVWTGSEMIVWGGERKEGFSIVYESTGGLYNPVTDSWTDTQTDNAPTGRSSFVAIWTGTEMIIAGGATSGSAYDPLSNLWTATTDAPNAFDGLTAVWTGTDLLMWGSLNTLDGRVSMGNRYTPSSDSWSEITLTDAPAPRSPTTSVWTGSEMIIWGGYDNDTAAAVGTGGRYNPDSDTWVPTSDSPIGNRWLHSAIWSGFEMIVWGGFDSGNSTLIQGARYDPQKDTWKLTSTSNAPSGMNRHQAIWTGTEMVIWGGHRSSYTSALGIYYPSLKPLTEVIKADGFEDPVPDSGE